MLKPSSYEDLRPWLAPEDVGRVAAALPAPYDRLVRLAAGTGMRAGELAGLQLRDHDPVVGRLRVRRAVTSLNGVLVYGDTKTRRHRDVVLATGLAAELDNYLAEHRAQAARWFVAHPEVLDPGVALPMFVGSTPGGAYRRADTTAEVDRLDYTRLLRHGAWYGRLWVPALRKAGVPTTVRFHDLRHAHISWLLPTLPVKDVQERVGHASATTTLDRYAHTNRTDADARARVALDAATVSPELPRTWCG